jgi:predicted nucleotidyltransferase
MKKVNLFQNLTSWTADNRIVRKAFKQFGATEEQFKEVSRMLKEGTEIKVIKEATAAEMVEYNKTYWQKIKELFNG